MLTHLSFPPSWSVFYCQNGASGSFLAPSLKVRNEKFKWFETGLATLKQTAADPGDGRAIGINVSSAGNPQPRSIQMLQCCQSNSWLDVP